MVKLSASILNFDMGALSSEVQRLQKAGATMLHLDVMDGVFVPNISIGNMTVKALRRCTDMCFDVHLMVKNPYPLIPLFVEAGADIITFHLESEGNPLETINSIRSFGKKVGISIKPKTPVETLVPFLPLVDMVLIMSVEPGFGGQSIIEETLKKIPVLREKGFKGDIEVDGGVNDKTAGLVASFGANILVAGSFLQKAESLEAGVRTIEQCNF